MKKLMIFGLLLLILAGCNQRSEDLEESIKSVVEDKNKDEIDVNAYTNVDWEKAFLFTPYSPTERIEEQLETSFTDTSNIDMRDDYK